MLTSMKRVAVAAAGLLILGAGTARAETLEVKVPFAFTVKGHTLPAGKYRLEQDELNRALVVLRGEGPSKSAVVLLTTPARGSDPAGNTPALTFERLGGRLELANIWESAGEGEAVPLHR